MVSLRSFDLLRKVRSHAEARPDSVAITDIPNGLSITYPAFLQDIVSLGGALLSGSETDLDEARVVVLCEKGYLVALCLVAVWAAGGLAVPILPSLPIPEQSYIVENSESTIILCDEKNKQRSEALAKIVVDAGGRCQVKVISLSDIRSETKLDSADLTSHLDKFSELEGDRRAMMLYTSGTVSI
jgi:malonyl-CoA/methylmalonyl-CoA synthetase